MHVTSFATKGETDQSNWETPRIHSFGSVVDSAIRSRTPRVRGYALALDSTLRIIPLHLVEFAMKHAWAAETSVKDRPTMDDTSCFYNIFFYYLGYYLKCFKN